MTTLNLDPTWVQEEQIELPLKQMFVFPGGEVQVKLGPYIGMPSDILIKHRVNNSQNLMELMLATDAVRRQYPKASISAYLPYLPYARQDRKMVSGEAFSLQVLADILSLCKFEKIFCLDPHSDVAGAVIRNLEPVWDTHGMAVLIDTAKSIQKEFGEFILCAPDGGALKKIYKQAAAIKYTGTIVCGGKIRDLETGKIIRTTLDLSALNAPGTPEVNTLEGKTVWIIDDICDGGRTFTELAKVLRDNGAKHVVLWVTHGIFSKGADNILASGDGSYLDKVFTTNSVSDETFGTDKIVRHQI